MARVRPAPIVPEVIHNAEAGGVKVTIQLHSGRAGEEMLISLPGACSWQGRVLDLAQRFVTDEAGRVIVMLPPSEEIKSLTSRNRVPGLYKLVCAPIGTLTFEVPNVPEWTLGQE